MKKITLGGDRIEVSEEKFEELKKLLESPKRFKPKMKQVYHSVNSIGGKEQDIWTNHKLDNYRYEVGNCFETEADLDHAEAVRKARVKIENSTDFEPSWEDEEQEKWVVYYDYQDKELHASSHTFIRDYGQVYYASEEEAEQAIEDLESEFKLIMGIDE